MPSDKKKTNTAKKTEKGSVGVLHQGLLKSKGSLLFWSENKDPEEEFNNAKKYYGTYTRARYVVCEEPEKVFAKVAKSFQKVNELENLYLSNSSSLIAKIKEEAGVKAAKTMGETKKKGESKEADGSDDENEDASGDDKEESGSEDEKPVKVAKGSKSGKKDKEEESTKKSGKKDKEEETKGSKKSGKKDKEEETKGSKKSGKKDKEESEDESGSDAGSGDEAGSGDDDVSDVSEDEAPVKAKKTDKSSGKKDAKKDDKKTQKSKK